jgi:ubiquinone/menaquinone biosynthesis C-methylase UbiE
MDEVQEARLMSETDKVFAGAIPDVYDDYLVPLIFETYAVDLAKSVASFEPKSVLETAAGSGVVTRELAPLLSDDARYWVTDLNQPMLDRALRRQPADDRIEWRQADALNLPFEEETFDVICCQFGVMFFPDKVAGYRSALRTLRDGGKFIFNVWDRIEENVFADSVTRTASAVFPADPPLFLARTPHGYHDVALIEAELDAAGFQKIEVHTIASESRAESPRVPAVAYCQGTPLRNELEARDPSKLEEVTDRATADLEKRYGTGPVSGKIQGHVIIATR